MALLLTCGDGEERGEVYGCAADRQQASIVFEVAADMVRMCPALNKRVKILASQKRIVYQSTNSFYQVLSAEAYSKHGFNIHGVVFDELHTQPNRKLFDGEVKVLLDYLAENAQQVEMSVDNIDDWAYDKNFVGKLSHYVGKATLKIKYQSSNNIGKAIERIKQGHDVAEYKKHEHGYFICWKFDDIYEIYGLPSEQIAIDRDTTCIVVDYYLRNLNENVKLFL